MTAQRQELRSLTVTVLGAGRAGGAFAAALVAAGCTDLRLYSRDRRQGRALARRLSRPDGGLGASAAPRCEAELDRAIAHGGALLIAVRDAAIEGFAAELAATWPAQRGPRWALHCAGALSTGVLSALADRGAATGVFHPVVALQGPGSAASLAGAFATLSGDPAARRLGRRLARAFGMRPLEVDDALRPRVHMAAVMAAGDLTALLAAAEGLLETTGIGATEARELLSHLAASALEAYRRMGPGQALTGPAARGDIATLAQHLAATKGSEDGRRIVAGATAAHRVLARLAAELARDAGRLNDEQLDKLRCLLD